MIKKFTLLLIIAALTACTCYREEKQGNSAISEHAQTMATLYNYYADEYRALAFQAYNIAKERIDDIRRQNPDNGNLAIVVDIDETILDNSPHQALMIMTDSAYPYMWNKWCDLARAKPVPGAVEFLQYADEQGFNVFYISNRKEKYTREGTLKNLQSLGFPQLKNENFLLRLDRTEGNPNPSDKQGRRDEISLRGFEIVLLVGDNLGDFYTDEQGQPARASQMESYREEFGRRFIILPNAMYGNWPASVGISDEASLDSLLNNMTMVFE